MDDVQQVLKFAVPILAEANVRCLDLQFGKNTFVMPFNTSWGRPGGTLSGPAMMTLADIGIYIGFMSMTGLELMAVTSNLNISFLARPAPGDLFAKTRILKSGKRLAYGETMFYSSLDDDAQAVAHATATYAMPPKPTGLTWENMHEHLK